MAIDPKHRENPIRDWKNDRRLYVLSVAKAKDCVKGTGYLSGVFIWNRFSFPYTLCRGLPYKNLFYDLVWKAEYREILF